MLAGVPLPFPSMPRNLPDFGLQPCTQIPVRAAREPAWTWLTWLHFGVMICTSPFQFQGRAPWSWDMPMPSLFLSTWVAFAVSPARCDLQRRSDFPQTHPHPCDMWLYSLPDQMPRQNFDPGAPVEQNPFLPLVLSIRRVCHRGSPAPAPRGGQAGRAHGAGPACLVPG